MEKFVQGNHKIIWRFIFLVCLSILLNGCLFYKKAPDAKTIATMALPSSTVIPAHYIAQNNSSCVTDNWLADYKDPILNQLVELAIKNNPDITAAAAKVDIANGAAIKAAANLYPSVASYGRLSFKNGIDSNMTVGLSGVGLFFGWQLDLWGQIRSQAAAGELNYQAAQADYQFVEESLAAEVAKAWFTGNLATAQVSLGEQLIATYQKLLNLVQQQNNVGQVSQIDVEAIKSELATAEDALKHAQIAQSEAARSLEILIGRYPCGFLQFENKLPYIPAAPPAGLPSQLLERRWDIIAAEKRVAASFHNVQAAKAAQLPQINLSAGMGIIDGALSSFTGNNHFYNYGGNFIWPLFTGGSMEADVDIAIGDRKQALAEFAHTALQAFMQVENALSNEQNLIGQHQAISLALASDQKSLQLKIIRYQVGQTSMTDVLQQQLIVIQDKANLSIVKSQLLLNRTDLYLALGGGFNAKQG